MHAYIHPAFMHACTLQSVHSCARTLALQRHLLRSCAADVGHPVDLIRVHLRSTAIQGISQVWARPLPILELNAHTSTYKHLQSRHRQPEVNEHFHSGTHSTTHSLSRALALPQPPLHTDTDTGKGTDTGDCISAGT